MVKYKRTKGKRKVTPKNLENKPFRRFVELERKPAEDVLSYIHEIIEIVYHTILPFVAGYYFGSDLPYKWIGFGFLLIPLIFRFKYLNKEKKSKIYFRL